MNQQRNVPSRSTDFSDNQEQFAMKISSFNNASDTSRRNNILGQSKQLGFTLFELLVVVVILGVLAAIAAPTIGDGQKMADVTAYFQTADRLSTNWKYVTAKCQTPSNVDSTTITGSASTAAALTANLQLLVDGTGASANFQGCVGAAKLEPLNRNSLRGNSGAYTLNGSIVSLTNVVQNSMNRVGVTFSNVEEAAALELVQKYGGQSGASTLATLSASDSTDKAVQYTAATNGVRSVTIIR